MGDFLFNVVNVLMVCVLLDMQFIWLMFIYDFNVWQVLELVGLVGFEWFEVIVYQYFFVFYIEYCVFCCFFLDGIDYINCGYFCELYWVVLKDECGVQYLVMVDVGCCNMVFEGCLQVVGVYLFDWLDVGLCDFCFEFVYELFEQVCEVIVVYWVFLNGEIGGLELENCLCGMVDQGVMEGSFFVFEGFDVLFVLLMF